MTKHIELKTVNQGTALASTLALPPLVIEGLAEFKGSFDRLCLQAGTAAIETMLAADAEQLCGKRYQRHADRQGHRWGMINNEVDEMLTVIRIGLPDQLRRSLGCTNAIESLSAVLRKVCCNVNRWRDARMAWRWTGTAMLEAEKSFRRLKAPTSSFRF